MKILFTVSMMLFLTLSHAQEGADNVKTDSDKVCVNIPGRGLNNDKIAKTCKKGDIIQVDKKNIPFLCDFNFAITIYSTDGNHACVYLGRRRHLRDGTNF